MFQIEFSVKRCNADSEHAGRLFSGAFIELERHFDVFPLLVANKIVELLTDSPFGLGRLLEHRRFMENMRR